MSLILCSNASSAHVNIRSESFSVDIDAQTLEIRLERKGFLVINVDQLERGGPVASFQLIVANPTKQVVPLSPIHFRISDSIEAEQDAGGGLGASFYAYLDPFVADASGIVQIIQSGDTMPEIHDWFGWTNRYRFEAIRFTDDLPGRLEISDAEQLNPENLVLVVEKEKLNPGESLLIRFDYLIAVKTRQFLSNPEVRLEGLLLNNLWQWLRTLCFLLWGLLDLLFKATGSWGIAIITLALIIRIITIPITRYSLHQQQRAIQQQARIAPLLKEIKQNYSGAQQSEKIIELYEDQNYAHLAPFKSMSGLMIQIPIFVALFNVLGDAFEVSGQSFLWITDLALSDRLFSWNVDIPYFGRYFNLLPVIMSAITILSTWLASRRPAKQEGGNSDATSITLFGMGAVFLVLFYSFPAALVLYWLSSNLFQLIQQSITNAMETRAQ